MNELITLNAQLSTLNAQSGAAIGAVIVFVCAACAWLVMEKLRHATRVNELRSKLVEACRVQASTPATIPVPSARATALSEEMFCRVWREVEDDNAGYLAVQQLVAREIIDAVGRVADARLAGKPELTHASGMLEALLTLSENLDVARRNPEAWTSKGAKLRRKAA